MKKVLSLFLILIITGVVCFYCFVYKKHSSSTKKLTFWSIQLKPVYEKPILKIIDEFKKTHEGFDVVWVDIPIQEAQKRTLASILSSNPPDLINLNPDFSIILAQRNALYTFSKEDTEQFHPSLVNKLKYNDKIYALPFYETSPVTIYNKELFDKCKIDEKSILTYDDLYNVSKQNNCSIALFASSINENDAFAKILNKYDISSLQTKDEKQKAYEIYNIFNEMYKSNNLPKDVLSMNHREVVEKYMSNKAMMIVAGSNFINMIKQNAPDTYSKTAIKEQLTGKNGKYDIAIMNLIIPKKSKNIKEALDFALLLTNKENQLELSKITNVIPANRYTLEDSYFKTQSNDIYEKARYLSARQLDKLNDISFGNQNKKVINEEINKTLEEILLNSKSDKNFIKSKVDELSNAIEKLINNN